MEDDERVRGGLGMLIGGSPGFELVGSFADAESARDSLSQIKPHVVLMDIHLPKQSGIEFTQMIKPELPHTQIIMLTVFDDDERVFEALRAGAEGYLIKNTPPIEILEAIQEVHRGGSPMSSAIARKVVAHFRANPQALRADSAACLPSLSPREDEIAQLLVKGYRYKEVADELSCSIHTVREHLRRICQKLHATSSRDAVAKYLQSGAGNGTKAS